MKTQGLMKSKLIVKLEKLIGDVTLKELKTPSHKYFMQRIKNSAFYSKKFEFKFTHEEKTLLPIKRGRSLLEACV